jgi:hydrogenase maturation protease
MRSPSGPKVQHHCAPPSRVPPVAATGCTTVLGIGNTLLSDEGLGVHVVNYLISIRPRYSGMEIVDGGTLGFELLTTVENAVRLVVIDAAMLGREPGAIEVLRNEEMDAYLGLPRRSAHEVGLRDLLDMARLNCHLPPRRALIAVQPARIEWGESLSTAVGDAVISAASAVLQVIEEWDKELCQASP